MSSVAQQVDLILADAAKARSWGAIEISLQDGKPVIIKTTTTKKLFEESTPNDVRTQRRY